MTPVEASAEQVSGEWVQVYGTDDGYDCIHRRFSTINVVGDEAKISNDYQMGTESKLFSL